MVAFLAAGCGGGATEIIVAVDSDLSVPDELDQLRIEVTSPEGEMRGSIADLGPGQAPLPRTLGLVHEHGPLGPFTIRAVGLLDMGIVVEQRAVTSFLRGKRLLLEMELLEVCDGVPCGGEATCIAGACGSAAIDPGTLPPWDGPLVRSDGGQRRDAGGADAGVMCGAGTADCDGRPDNGCETDITTRDHCGDCTTVCRGSDRCTDGMCM